MLKAVFHLPPPVVALLLAAAASAAEAPPMNDPVTPERLQAALEARGPDYRPRTRHLDPDGTPRYTNRLILEESPYLLQHAHNPVAWHPWGEAAFARARAEGKPVFLSIGYSTCHWCHVMEHESFENEELAELLNHHFIAVKVDREQHPDVDAAYMNAVVAINGHGGWPLSALLTPEGKPFFGGTYLPPGQFRQLLLRVHKLWQRERRTLLADAERVAAALAAANGRSGAAAELDAGLIGRAAAGIVASYDEFMGGFGQAPKFPHEGYLLFLLEHYLRSGDPAVLEAAVGSLDAMDRGGIHDQVGGGFHRYSVDPEWLVPHFEKMLYNQAWLARAYLAAHRITGAPRHARTVRRTLDYVLREMTSPEGGFHSATDADSEGGEGGEGGEGSYFLWTPAQLREALGPEEGGLAAALFGATGAGNFEGSNILHLPRPPAELAAARGESEAAMTGRIDGLLERLRRARAGRVAPLRDDKIITAWNGMMIAALAEAGQGLGEPRYRQAAVRAAEALWRHNRGPGGELLRTDGPAAIPATFEDYAYLIDGLLALYDLGRERRWLERARGLAEAMRAGFEDPAAGGFFLGRAAGPEAALGRLKEGYDGALPAANAVAARALFRLARRGAGEGFEQAARTTLAAFAAEAGRQPAAYASLLGAAAEGLHGEAGAQGYAGRGGVWIAAERTAGEGGDETLRVRLELQPGWHVNAAAPLPEGLVATELGLDATGWRLGPVSRPEPVRRRLGFSGDTLALYEGEVTLSAPLLRDAGAAAAPILTLGVRLQACSDRVCLPPETVMLRLPSATPHHPGESQ